MRLLPIAAPGGLVLAAAAAAVAVACGSVDGAATSLSSSGAAASGAADGASEDGDASRSGLTVVATTSILGDVTADVVGDAGSVEVLMAPGVDPHSFQASAAQAQSLREADLVISNGLGLEESMADTLAAAEQDGAVIVEVGPALDPIALDEPHDHDQGPADDDHADEGDHADDDATHDDHDHADEDTSNGFDPHVWLDASRMATGAVVIAEAIAQVDDELGDDEWQARGQSVADDLEALDAELEDVLAVVPADRRMLVTNHDSLEYFADRHDFDVVGTVIPGTSTQVDVSAESFTQLAEVITSRGVPAIFTDVGVSDRLATALVEETGTDVDVVVLYTGGLGEPGSGAETYAGLMRFNAGAVAAALE